MLGRRVPPQSAGQRGAGRRTTGTRMRVLHALARVAVVRKVSSVVVVDNNKAANRGVRAAARPTAGPTAGPVACRARTHAAADTAARRQ